MELQHVNKVSDMWLFKDSEIVFISKDGSFDYNVCQFWPYTLVEQVLHVNFRKARDFYWQKKSQPYNFYIQLNMEHV